MRSMNMTIIEATNVIEGHAEATRANGGDARRLDDLVVSLRKLAETAHLRDEAWAAMKAYGQRFIDVDDDSVDNERNDWIAGAREDEKTCDAICRKVAETET